MLGLRRARPRRKWLDRRCAAASPLSCVGIALLICLLLRSPSSIALARTELSPGVLRRIGDEFFYKRKREGKGRQTRDQQLYGYVAMRALHEPRERLRARQMGWGWVAGEGRFQLPKRASAAGCLREPTRTMKSMRAAGSGAAGTRRRTTRRPSRSSARRVVLPVVAGAVPRPAGSVLSASLCL